MNVIAEIRHVTKTYERPGSRERQVVLDDISLTVSPGSTIAITGPSGSGKSTLLNILGILDKPGSGTVTIDGQDVGILDEAGRAGIRNRKIGFVFQMHHLLPQLTVFENVILPSLARTSEDEKRDIAARARTLLRRLEVDDLSDEVPSRLSVGECQRVALARGLVTRPSLLLADEPTGSLDAVNAAKLGLLLTGLNREEGLAIVVVTHSSDLAALMQTEYRLTGGKLHLTRKE